MSDAHFQILEPNSLFSTYVHLDVLFQLDIVSVGWTHGGRTRKGGGWSTGWSDSPGARAWSPCRGAATCLRNWICWRWSFLFPHKPSFLGMIWLLGLYIFPWANPSLWLVRSMLSYGFQLPKNDGPKNWQNWQEVDGELRLSRVANKSRHHHGWCVLFCAPRRKRRGMICGTSLKFGSFLETKPVSLWQPRIFILFKWSRINIQGQPLGFALRVAICSHHLLMSALLLPVVLFGWEGCGPTGHLMHLGPLAGHGVPVNR